jgi:hypothetical protein
VGRILYVILWCAAGSIAATSPSLATPPGCLGNATLGKVRVSVYLPGKSELIPIKELAAIPSCAKLIWDPVRLPLRDAEKSEIAILIVPRGGGNLIVLPVHPAKQYLEWDLPDYADVVALVLGPDGLNINKVKSLVANNTDLLTQLADYAQQASAVELLVQQLADSEQRGAGTDAALKGFASRWGVVTPRLDSSASANQQAAAILRATLPTTASYDPLASADVQMQQTSGLAASVAGLFFGNGVGLAAGGAALVTNLKSALFPNTEFRSAFAQSAESGALAFCAKSQPAKLRTHLAYLWAYRIPHEQFPVAALTGARCLPLGAKSTVQLKTADGATGKSLARARDWRLVPLSGGIGAPVTVAIESTPDSLELDLTKPEFAAGDYRITAAWDWDSVSLGTVHLRPFGDLKKVEIPPASRDKLVEGSGTVTVKLTGTDFEFVNKVELQKVVPHAPKPSAVLFDLPLGARQGEQKTMTVDIDTASPGQYRLLLAQSGDARSDGAAHALPIAILPPNPKISGLPIRVNIGEKEQELRLEGSGLARVETASSAAGAISGDADGDAWAGKIQLNPEAKPGQRFSLLLKVQGRQEPLTLENAILVVGPRPSISSVQKSLPPDPPIEIRDDELPAGTSVGLLLAVSHLRQSNGEAGRPQLDLSCSSGELRKALTLEPDERTKQASLSFAGPDALFLAIDPGSVGYPDCELAARVRADPRGASDPFPLGRVVRLPVLDQFTLTDQSLGANVYAGTLRGRDLDVIEKTGWDAGAGQLVAGIPTPVVGEPGEEVLRVALPWPAPAPHAPLYIWLHGETTGRHTSLTN